MVRASGRLVSLYLAASALAATGMVAAVTISAIAAERILGDARWSGLPMAASILGTAIGSQIIGRSLERFPLRRVLASQYALALLGGGLAVFGVARGQFAWLVLGLLTLGLGNGATQYVRYLAGDLFSPARRAQVLGWVVWMSGVGAVFGPSLLAPSGRWAMRFSLPEEAGPYLTAMVVFTLCATAYFTVVPKDLYADRGEEDQAGADTPACPAQDLRTTRWPQTARLALLAMVVGHVVMVFVMTMTPIHLTHHGANLGAVGMVISAHMAGMFLFAPVAGWLCNRLGTGTVLLSGSVVLTAACLLAGLSASTLMARLPMAAPLFLLGLGWNLGFVSGSTLLSNSLPPRNRIRGRAFADACVWTGAATSSLTSSLLFSVIGFTKLSWLGCALAIGLTVTLAWKYKALRTPN